MNILVLGSEGFIGSHCISYFLKKGDRVYGIDLYEQPTQKYFYKKVSRLSPDLDEFFGEIKLDGVINAAGSGNVPYSMSHPVLDFEANSLDTIRVLDAMRKHQPQCKYVHLSSAAVYGNPTMLPIKENDATHPLSPYGWHKLMAEQICKEYTSVFGMPTAIARPFSVFGPGLKKQLFWDVFQKQKESNELVSLFGTGNESRDYIYISDLVCALDYILQKGEMIGEMYNLASGEETTIKEATSIFFEELKSSKSFQFTGETRAGDPLNWRADISKLTKLGYKREVGLQDGLRKLSGWLLNSVV